MYIDNDQFFPNYLEKDLLMMNYIMNGLEWKKLNPLIDFNMIEKEMKKYFIPSDRIQ